MSNAKITNLFPVPTTGVTTGELLSVGAVTPVQFATTYNVNTRYVIFDVRDQSVYVTVHGETPSASAGSIIAAGQSVQWHVEVAKKAKFLATTGTAKIYASQFTD